MRFRHAFAVTALSTLFAATASAQDTKPDVSENAWVDFDFSSSKNGEWVKYKLVRDGEKPVEYRVACVGVEADVVWIEEDRTTAEFFPGTVILCSIGIKDRKVKRAFWGKPGEKGRELNLTRRQQPNPGNDAAKGTGEVATATIKIKDKDHESEKVEIKTEVEGFEGSVKDRQVIVVAQGIPFPLATDEKGECRVSISEGTIAWKSKPSWKGGLYSMQFDGRVKSTLSLADWGTDAKATLFKG
ncbi:MAG: hypothetical protein IT452_01875 [Planctomycetia bacterium]|nr:hypothetical protein [Planctomycetia bacterium]